MADVPSPVAEPQPGARNQHPPPTDGAPAEPRFEHLTAALAELASRLDAVERRLLAIEAPDAPPRASVGTRPAAAPFPAPSAVPPTVPPTTPPGARTAAFIDARSEMAASLAAATDAKARPRSPASDPATAPAPPALRPVLSAESSSAPVSTRRAVDLEALIGGRWYAIAGALVLIVGVALVLKYAWNEGWLGRLPGGLRCMIGAAFGIGLLALAQLAQRRVNAWAAVGLNGAGLGTIYAASYIAYAVFESFGPGVAGVLLIACAALGVAIGLHGRLVPVTVIALAGAYATPLLVGRSGGNAWVLPPYWLMLLVTGLGISTLRGGWFVVVRWLVWGMTLLLGAAWIVAFADEHPGLGCAFLALAWSIVHVELWWSSLRDPQAVAPAGFGTLLRRLLMSDLHLGRGPMPRPSTDAGAAGAGSIDGASSIGPSGPPALPDVGGSSGALPSASRSGAIRAVPLSDAIATTAPLFGSFLFTTWAVLLGIVVMRRSGIAPDWLPPAGAVCAALAAAIPMIGHLRILREPPVSATERLGAGLWLQSAAAAIVAIALALADWTQVIAWLALGTAGVAVGRLLSARPVVAYGLALMAIGSARLLVFERLVGSTPTNGFEFAGIFWSQWSGLAAFGAFGTALSAWLLLRGPLRANDADALEVVPRSEAEHRAAMAPPPSAPGRTGRVLATALVAIATLMAMLALGDGGGAATTLAWIILAVGVLILRRALPPIAPALVLIAVAVVSIASAMTLLDRVVGERSLPLATLASGLSLTGFSLRTLLCAAGFGVLATTMLEIVRKLEAGRVDQGAGTEATSSRVARASRIVRWRRGAVAAAGAGTALLIAGLLGGGSTSTAVVILLAALASAVALLDGLTPALKPLRLDVHAFTIAGVAAMAWFTAFVIPGWGRFEDPLFLHRGLLLSIGLAIEFSWLASRVRPLAHRGDAIVEPAIIGASDAESEGGERRPATEPGGVDAASAPHALTTPSRILNRLLPDPARAATLRGPLDADQVVLASALIVPPLLLLASTSLEIARFAGAVASDETIRGAAVSGWWGVVAVGLLWIGFRHRRPIVRRAGLALLGAAAAKALILDTATVSSGWRAISLVGLGLLMVGVGAAYSALAKREAGAAPSRDRGGSPAP